MSIALIIVCVRLALWLMQQQGWLGSKAEPKGKLPTSHALEYFRLFSVPTFLLLSALGLIGGLPAPSSIRGLLTFLFVFSFPALWLPLVCRPLGLVWTARLYRWMVPLSVREDARALGWWQGLRRHIPDEADLEALVKDLQREPGTPTSGVGVALWGLVLVGRGQERQGLQVLRFGARLCDLTSGAAGRRVSRQLLQCRAAQQGDWAEVARWSSLLPAGRGDGHADQRRWGALAQRMLAGLPVDRACRAQLWWMKAGWGPLPPLPSPPMTGPPRGEGEALRQALTLHRDAALLPPSRERAAALALAWAAAMEAPGLEAVLRGKEVRLGLRGAAAGALAQLRRRAVGGLRPLLRRVGPTSAPHLAGELLEEARRAEVHAALEEVEALLPELRELRPLVQPRYELLATVAGLLDALDRLQLLGVPLELSMGASRAVAPLIDLAAALHNDCGEPQLAHWMMRETLETARAAGQASRVELLEANLKVLS